LGRLIEGIKKLSQICVMRMAILSSAGRGTVTQKAATNSKLKSALVGKSTVELYCDLEGLRAPGGGSILADILTQAQRLDLVILDWSVHGRQRIAVVQRTCPWDTDVKRPEAEECKALRCANLKTALSNEGWDCCVYLIEVGAWNHILKLVKDRLRAGGACKE
jgi:hypothetical protein